MELFERSSDSSDKFLSMISLRLHSTLVNSLSLEHLLIFSHGLGIMDRGFSVNHQIYHCSELKLTFYIL